MKRKVLLGVAMFLIGMGASAQTSRDVTSRPSRILIKFRSGSQLLVQARDFFFLLTALLRHVRLCLGSGLDRGRVNLDARAHSRGESDLLNVAAFGRCGFGAHHGGD